MTPFLTELLMPAYDPNNIFAKILRGEIPSITVYEDQDTIAIMDIMPQVDGHVLVIPRASSRNLLDAGHADFVPSAQRSARCRGSIGTPS